MEKLKNNYIVQGWLVLLLTLCFGSALAGVQMVLSPKIEANKINETRQKVPGLILGKGAVKRLEKEGRSLEITPRTVSITKNNRTVSYKLFQVIEKGETSGWVVKSSGQGYADKIELLIGLDPSLNKILGLFILEQKETPGLGNKITEWEFRKQFISKSTNMPIVASKTGATSPDEINAITGATISSRSICSIINTAVKDIRASLKDKGSPKNNLTF